MKRITMAQWKNLNRYSSFVNPPRLPFFCEISGALLLALPGLTAGRQAGRQAGRLSDEIRVNLQNFKIRYRSKYLRFCCVFQRYSVLTALPMHSSRVFRLKLFLRWVVEVRNFGKPYISWAIPTIKHYRA